MNTARSTLSKWLVCLTAWVICCELDAALPNDRCEGALPIHFTEAAQPVPYDLDTTHATSERDPSPECRSDSGKGVWFTVSSVRDGILRVRTCRSTFDTVLALYSGTCDALIPVACNDNDGPECADRTHASILVPIAAGQTNWVLAGGAGGQGGRLLVEASLARVFPTNWVPSFGITITNHAGNVEANVSYDFFASCGEVVDWRSAVQTGTDFVVDAQSIWHLGYGCLGVIVPVTHTYTLGRLAPGDYVFEWRNFGVPVGSVAFTVVPQPTFEHRTTQSWCPGASVFVTNTIAYSGDLVSLVWHPQLPSGWVLAGVSAPGAPVVADSRIVWEHPPPENPLTVVYEVRGPSHSDGLFTLRAEAEFQLSSMSAEDRVPVSPDPLFVGPSLLLEAGLSAEGQLLLMVHGPTPGLVEIQAADAPAGMSWTPVGTLLHLSAPTTFSLGTPSSYPGQRFFRARPLCALDGHQPFVRHHTSP